jgi:hypothetical protein
MQKYEIIVLWRLYFSACLLFLSAKFNASIPYLWAVIHSYKMPLILILVAEYYCGCHFLVVFRHAIINMLRRKHVTQWTRVQLQKPPVLQLLTNFPTCYGTRSFSTMLTKTRNLSSSWTRWIQSRQTLRKHINEEK